MSTTESGFAKNAANLKDLIIRLKTLGTAYQPPKQAFQIESLELLSKNADEAIRVLSHALPVYSKAVDEQELIFKPLSNLITRSYNYLKAAIDNPAELQTAKTLAYNLRGMASKITKTDGTTTQPRARVSYDTKVENVKQYIDVLVTSKIYSPAEADISIAALQSILASMENNITAVAIAKTPVDDARKNRINVFYDKQIGLVAIVKGVKNYIKASLKSDHPQRKHILALTFSK